ncbi:MAG: hypothetical protein Q9165_003051 [Trypethelium subeluteriae]
MLAAPGWGSRIVQSRNVRVPSNKFPHERWIFMNGVAQTYAISHSPIDGKLNLEAAIWTCNLLLTTLLQLSSGHFLEYTIEGQYPFENEHLVRSNILAVWVLSGTLGSVLSNVASATAARMKPTVWASPETLAVETPQAPRIIEQPLSASPDGSPASEVNVAGLERAVPPFSQNEHTTSSLEQAPAGNSIRPSSPGLSAGKMAEAVVNTTNVGPRTFFWKSLSEGSGRAMKEGQSSNDKEQDHAKGGSSAATLISPRDGAYDGAYSDLGHYHRHDEKLGHTNEGHEHIIPVIEHYCNELDMVPRWGVLNNVRSQPQLRYAGSVFIHRQMSGHLFNRHYLDTMFPMNKRSQHFLDQVVDVDIGTAKARASALASSVSNFAEVEPGARNWLLYDSITELVPPSTFFVRILALILYIRLSLTEGSWLGSLSLGQRTRIVKEGVGLVETERMGIDLEHVRNGDNLVEKAQASAETVEDEEASAAIEESRGKTVRQLSRLWRYMYGGTA